MSNEKRTGIWTDADHFLDPENGPEKTVRIFGNEGRDESKPLAIVYADEIIIPVGVRVIQQKDLGAIRFKLVPEEEKGGAGHLKKPKLHALESITCGECGYIWPLSHAESLEQEKNCPNCGAERPPK